jgi:uncharacterized membrane protein YczE
VLSYLTSSLAVAVKPAAVPVRAAGRAARAAGRPARTAAAPVRDAARHVRHTPTRETRHARTSQLLTGLGLVGVGVGLLVRADLGVASWDVLHVGVASASGMSVGTIAMLVGVAAAVLAAMLGERPRPGSLIPLLVVGPVIDLTMRLVSLPTTAAGQLAMLLTGMVLLAVGVGAYVTSDHGAGPGDLVFLAVARRGLPVWAARLLVDGGAVTAGWLLGGPVGIGTVLVTAGLGPLVAASIRVFDLAPARAEIGRRDLEFSRARCLELHDELEGV